MPRTISIGARGREVRTLQLGLNFQVGSALPPLTVDGIFGPKTAARVREYQGQFGLTVDGIVGPRTWDDLLLETSEAFPRSGCDCGNVDSHNLALAKSIQQEFLQNRPAGAISLLAPAARPFFATGQRRLAPSLRGAGAAVATPSAPGPAFRALDSAQKGEARAVFGDSLDFGRIFISSKAGLQNRPFTIAVAEAGRVVQIMNCGSFAPDKVTLIHQLAHVWQSQHHSDPFRFMVNAVDCQAGAVAANREEVLHDATVLAHPEHSDQFPCAASAFVLGFGLAGYAAEQMANAIERGDDTVSAHVKSVPRNVVDPACVAGLRLLQFEDRRLRAAVA